MVAFQRSMKRLNPGQLAHGGATISGVLSKDNTNQLTATHTEHKLRLKPKRSRSSWIHATAASVPDYCLIGVK